MFSGQHLFLPKHFENCWDTQWTNMQTLSVILHIIHYNKFDQYQILVWKCLSLLLLTRMTGLTANIGFIQCPCHAASVCLFGDAQTSLHEQKESRNPKNHRTHPAVSSPRWLSGIQRTRSNPRNIQENQFVLKKKKKTASWFLLCLNLNL